jgi:rhamnose transport system permease protein
LKSKKQTISRLNFSFNRREYATVIIIILVLIISAIYKPELFMSSQRNELIHSILLWLPLIVTVASGMMMVICMGNIDVSVGSIVGLTGMIVGSLFKFYNLPFWLGVIAAIVIGMAAGAFNGLFISYLGIPSLIMTLATMSLYRGAALMVTNGVEIDAFSLPKIMSTLIKEGPIPNVNIPWLVWIALLISVIMIFIMRYSHFGREVYAVGNNENAAALRGINVKKVRFIAFTLTGMFAGIAGLMYGSRYGYMNPSNTGNGLEFVVIAATVIGGVSMSGGTGNIIGVMLGCLLLGIVQTLIPSLGFSTFYNKAIYGLIILISLLIDKNIQNSQIRYIMRKGVTL